MSIAIIEAQFTAALQTVITDACNANDLSPIWPIRWPNEGWSNLPPGITESDQNVPVTTDGDPIPFIEAAVISGHDSSCVAPKGSRQSTTIGVFRVYLVAPQRSGRAGVNILADAVHDAFKRQTIFNDPPRRLYTWDPRIDDNVAQHIAQTDARIDLAVPAPWKGARYVRQCSTPWFYDYLS